MLTAPRQIGRKLDLRSFHSSDPKHGVGAASWASSSSTGREDNLEPILLPPLPECWDFRGAPLAAGLWCWGLDAGLPAC